jgi:hypothetical protein
MYSGGSASGMVAISCATFMIGPFRPPSAAASSAALRARVEIEAEQPAPAMRAGHAADIGADAGIAAGAGGEAVFLSVGHKPRGGWVSPGIDTRSVGGSTTGWCRT